MGDTTPLPSVLARSIAPSVMSMVEAMARAQRDGGLGDEVWVSANGMLGLAMNRPDIKSALGLGSVARAEFMSGVYYLAGIATWRKSQFIYRFDKSICDELMSTPTNALPAGVLKHLPSECVWLDVHHDGTESSVMAFLDIAQHLRLVLVGVFLIPDGSGVSVPFIESLELDSTVGDSIRKFSLEQGMNEAQRKQWEAHIGRIVSLLMYLCSEEPDITSKPSPMNQARIRRGKSPYHPTIHHVGYRIGAAFRKAKAEREASQGTGGHGASPAPHMRRAHWHTYWVGKENTPQRRQVVKWLPPIPVNVKSEDDIIPTIHRVSAGR